METIELDDFVLEPFDSDNMDHRYISVVLDNDVSFHDYVGETNYLIENAKSKQENGHRDCVYIIKNNDDYLGLITLITLNGKPYLAMGIIPNKQGYHFGKNVLKEYIEYLFREYPEYDKIFSSINPQNEKSINNVLKLGFNKVSYTEYVKTRE